METEINSPKYGSCSIYRDTVSLSDHLKYLYSSIQKLQSVIDVDSHIDKMINVSKCIAELILYMNFCYSSVIAVFYRPESGLSFINNI